MSLDLEIFTSERFLVSYRKASSVLRHCAERAIHDFVRRFRSNPKTVANGYDKLAHCKTRILEIDVARGPRLLAHFSSNKLVLLDLGDHEVVNRYNDKKYLQDSKTYEEALSIFWPENRSDLFLSSPNGTYEPKYYEEVQSDWIFFLDDQQNKVLEKTLKRIRQFHSTATFILGGPGTGKTCILLEMLCGPEPCGILMSDNLIKYIESSTGMHISQYKTDVSSLEFDGSDILLFDDPSKETIDEVLNLWKEGRICRHIVVAFDPLQLNHSITDQAIQTWKKIYGVNFYQLSDCYRQKENVGNAAKEVIDTIADSSPFLAIEKKKHFRQSRDEVTKLSNEMNFLNPGGYTEIYPVEDTIEDIRKEVNRIRRRKDLMWKHAPGLLILLDNIQLSHHAKDVISPLEKIGYVTQMNLANVNGIKGLEYQHVFIFIDKKKYQELVQGFEGTGRATYESRRLLRIPFSRAKDSLVVFQIDNVS